jgi:predicted nucleotidyltransferase
MNRDHVIALLRYIKREYAQAYGIEALGFFGSTARGEDRPDRDLDVCGLVDACAVARLNSRDF